MFYVVLNQKKRRWQQHRNGLPQDSVLAQLLHNAYTNNQPTYERKYLFIYEGNLCITSQESSFEVIEQNPTDSLTLLTENYAKNHLKPNASKAHSISKMEKQTDHSKLLSPEHRWNTTQILYIWESNSIAHSAIEVIS